MGSYIDNIKFVPTGEDFIAPTKEEVQTSLSAYCPNDPVCFGGKNDTSTNLYKLLNGLTNSFEYAESLIHALTYDFNIFNTTSFLETWEEALGIPDECFSVDGVSIEQRRKQVIFKYAIDNIITKEDYIAVARFFGANIRISTLVGIGEFDYTLPLILSGNDKERKYTVIITFLGVDIKSFDNYYFPIIFDEYKYTFLQCLFKKIVPANVNVIYKYALT